MILSFKKEEYWIRSCFSN